MAQKGNRLETLDRRILLKGILGTLGLATPRAKGSEAQSRNEEATAVSRFDEAYTIKEKVGGGLEKVDSQHTAFINRNGTVFGRHRIGVGFLGAVTVGSTAVATKNFISQNKGTKPITLDYNLAGSCVMKLPSAVGPVPYSQNALLLYASILDSNGSVIDSLHIPIYNKAVPEPSDAITEQIVNFVLTTSKKTAMEVIDLAKTTKDIVNTATGIGTAVNEDYEKSDSIVLTPNLEKGRKYTLQVNMYAASAAQIRSPIPIPGGAFTDFLFNGDLGFDLESNSGNTAGTIEFLDCTTVRVTGDFETGMMYWSAYVPGIINNQDPFGPISGTETITISDIQGVSDDITEKSVIDAVAVFKGEYDSSPDLRKENPRLDDCHTRAKTDEDGGSATNTIKIESDGGGVARYQFTATGSVNQKDSGDDVRGNQASGHVGPKRGTDTFVFKGEITDLSVDGPATVYINDEEVTPENIGDSNEKSEGTITIKSEGGGVARYRIYATGYINQKDSGDTARGHVAEGHVGPDRGTDTFAFGGEIQTIWVDGPATVYINGRQVNPDNYGGNDSTRQHTIRIESNGGGVANYEFTVTGTVRQKDSGDNVSGNTASGHVGPDRGTDTFVYTGSITGFSLDGPATVYVDGEEIDPDSL